MNARKLQILYFIVMMIAWLGSCQSNSNHKPITISNQSNQSGCLIIDTNSIILKGLRESLKPDEVNVINKLPSLKKCEIDSWLLPLSKGIKGEEVKLVSYQGQTSKSYQLIIANDFGFYNFSDEKYFDIEQYLISIDKKTGALIDGVRIQGNTSGDSLGDSVVVGKGLILNVKVNSFFRDDTIFTNYKFMFLNPPESHNEKDVKEKSYLEKMLLLPNGNFKKI